MDAVAKGFGLGVGFVIGLVLVIAVVTILFFLLWELYKLTLRRKFTVSLFRAYSSDLLKQERFEELDEIKMIISLLEKEEAPKELLKKYEVDVRTEFVWLPTPDGGERLVFNRNRKIVRRKQNGK